VNIFDFPVIFTDSRYFADIFIGISITYPKTQNGGGAWKFLNKWIPIQEAEDVFAFRYFQATSIKKPERSHDLLKISRKELKMKERNDTVNSKYWNVYDPIAEYSRMGIKEWIDYGFQKYQEEHMFDALRASMPTLPLSRVLIEDPHSITKTASLEDITAHKVTSPFRLSSFSQKVTRVEDTNIGW
jgi:hypothetical protein